MPLPTNPTLSDVVSALRFCEASILTINKKMEEVMPCGVTTVPTVPTDCAAPVDNLLFECCDRLKLKAYKCEAPTGCDGATFPVGLQINVNEWPSMGEYPVYAMKLTDCVGGKAFVGLLGAVNGMVKTGVEIKIPNTAAASAIKMVIVDPITGAVIEGQEISIGLAPATTSNETSQTGTTSPGIVLDSGVTVTGPFEATIGDPDEAVWQGLWVPSTNNDQGLLVTTEQRMWVINGAKLDTGFTVVKTKEDDGFTGTFLDPLKHTQVHMAGSHPASNTNIGVYASTANVDAAAGGLNAAVFGCLNENDWTQTPESSGALGVRYNGNVYAGLFMGDILVTGDATLAGAAFGGWADYVLEPDYNLMPLAEVRAYIAEKDHP